MEEEDLFRMINQGENERIEFKRTDIFENTEKIAALIIAFRNRIGGKILFGIENDGVLEGANIDKDAETQRISNIVVDKCSPRFEISADLISTNDGDVLVVNVPRRENIPSALVERRDHKIKKRTYYIRTVNGNKLVTDDELKWMFKESGDARLEHSFPINITYHRKELFIPSVSAPSGVFDVVPFVNSLEANDVQFLLENEVDRTRQFFLEIVPFAILKGLALNFSHSWLIEVVRRKGERVVHPISVDVDMKTVMMSDIQLPSDSLLSTLSFKIERVLSGMGNSIVVPPETDIIFKLDEKNGQKVSILRITSPDAFIFDIEIRESHWCAGLPLAHPLRSKYVRIGTPIEETRNMEESLATITLDALFTGEFSFPDVENPLFNEHYQYGKILLDLIKESWDWDSFVEKLPHPMLYVLEDKIDEILLALKRLSKE